MSVRKWGWKQGINLNMPSIPEPILFEDGSVRSGKTLSIGYGFVREMLTNGNPDLGRNWLLAAPTMTQVKDPMFEAVYEACELWNVPYDIYRSDRKYAQVGPFRVYGFSADDKNDQRRVRGMTLGGAWMDEASETQEEFLDMVLGRCSLDYKRIVLSTNPKGPYHWLKVRFIDRTSEDVKRIAWQLEDNPYGIKQDYIDFLKRTLQGAHLRRDVYGEWAGHTGLVYPHFAPTPAPDKEPVEYHIAMDFASSSVSHALLIGIYDEHYAHVIDEWRWDGRKQGETTPDEQAHAITNWLTRHSLLPAQIGRTYVDPAASHMRIAMDRAGFHPKPADNEVLEGIYLVQGAFANGRIGVDPVCRWTVKELGGYEWDERAQLQGEDKPVKANDHACDALRYWVYSVLKRIRLERSSYA